MARSNNQDRPAPPHARAPYPGQPAEPGLPWADAGSPPADPHYPQQSYDPSLGNLPWPQQQAAPPPPPHQQPYPSQSYAPQPGYPPSQGYPPQQGYAAPPQSQPYPQPQHPTAPPQHYGYGGDPGHMASYQQEQAPSALPYPASGYPQDQHQRTAPPLRGSYGPNDGEYPAAPGYDQSAYDQSGYDLTRYATQPHPGQQRPSSPTAPPQAFNPAFGAGNPHANPHPGFAPQVPARTTQQARSDEGDEDEYDEEYDDYEEPKRRFSFLKVAASLVVAVGVGGGAAYAYKVYGGKFFGTHPPVVLRADASPAKSTPTNLVEPQPEHGERVAGAVPDVVPTGDDSVGGAPAGARRVQTIPISPEPTPQPSPSPAIRPTITMPGLAVEAPLMAPPQAPQAPQAPVKTQKMAGLTAPPPPPAARPVIKTINAAATADTTPASVAPPPAAKKVVVTKASKAIDAYSPTGGTGTANVATATAASATTAPAKSGGNGYVAVLFSSQGDAVAARKQLDALQSKYPDVLGNKPTDITPTTVKGTPYLRGIVGPPGSRQAAAEICNQLKAAGHTDCFITAY